MHSCKPGWSGKNCTVCTTRAGCSKCSFDKICITIHIVNGYCTIPGECICNSNWGGYNCSVGKYIIFSTNLIYKTHILQ